MKARRTALIFAAVLVAGPSSLVLPATAAVHKCAGRVATIASDTRRGIDGTRFDDVIWAGPKNNFIHGLGGNDIICSGGGDDVIIGDSGDDRLIGGAGNDTLLGWTGDDVLQGGIGIDYAEFYEAPESMFINLGTGRARGHGNDRLASIERVNGSKFDDVMIGSEGSESLWGWGGNDRIDARGGNDLVAGVSGADELEGGEGLDLVNYRLDRAPVVVDLSAGTGIVRNAPTDTLSGFEGVIGTEGDDQIMGDAANNFILPNKGADTIDTGEGHDIVWFIYEDEGVVVDLAAGTATGEFTDTLSNVEGAYGTLYDDTIRGSDGSNELGGFGGNNILEGRGGDDYLWGDLGDDTVDGGEGDKDVLDYRYADAGIQGSLSDGTATGSGNDTLSGIEWLFGTPFDDVLIGDSGANFLAGNGGDDILGALGGDDVIDGGDGEDEADSGEGADRCIRIEAIVSCETSLTTVPVHPIGFVEMDTVETVEKRAH
ncbi:MAG: hypothetical protein QOG54_24 [Actinomycetota bacterium]|jgi:Ca2+-binding RTX toxin-like protein|nr:hypothetical protein [Actinomycetota bacterium]